MWALGLDLNTLITYMRPCKWCETESGYVYVSVMNMAMWLYMDIYTLHKHWWEL